MSATAALLLGVVLLIGNAFFVAAEFAVISARRHRWRSSRQGAAG